MAVRGKEKGGAKGKSNKKEKEKNTSQEDPARQKERREIEGKEMSRSLSMA